MSKTKYVCGVMMHGIAVLVLLSSYIGALAVWYYPSSIGRQYASFVSWTLEKADVSGWKAYSFSIASLVVVIALFWIGQRLKRSAKQDTTGD